jgi:hypothetical protein
MLRNIIALVVAVAIGAIGYSWWMNKDAEESPINVMITQMRTRAIIEHERQITVWYRACPETSGINPKVMVIWPAKLNYELDLAATQLTLSPDGVLTVDTPVIRADDPVVPTEFGEYMAQTSFWTLDSEQAIVMREMQKSTPLARHLTGYFLLADKGLREHFKEELEAYLRGITGALGVVVKKVEINIPQEERVQIPPRPEITLCEGTVAVANGLPFARRQMDGTVIGVYPKRPAPAPKTP